MNEQRKYEICIYICIYCIYNGILISLKKDGNLTTCYVIAFVVQSLSRVRLSETPWTATCQASLSSTISQYLLKLMSIESMMPSNHLILCHPLLTLSLSQHQGLFQLVISLHQVAKILELQLQHHSIQ